MFLVLRPVGNPTLDSLHSQHMLYEHIYTCFPKRGNLAALHTLSIGINNLGTFVAEPERVSCRRLCVGLISMAEALNQPFLYA